jgi:hypothetical protein
MRFVLPMTVMRFALLKRVMIFVLDMRIISLSLSFHHSELL